jgi:hypothetical protein
LAAGTAFVLTVWLRRRGRLEGKADRRDQRRADERTIRRIAERQAGGVSSAEGAARYATGQNPGGLHHKAQRPPPDAEVFEIDEPRERTEPRSGARRSMAATRRGS